MASVVIRVTPCVKVKNFTCYFISYFFNTFIVLLFYHPSSIKALRACFVMLFVSYKLYISIYTSHS